MPARWGTFLMKKDPPIEVVKNDAIFGLGGIGVAPGEKGVVPTNVEDLAKWLANNEDWMPKPAVAGGSFTTRPAQGEKASRENTLKHKCAVLPNMACRGEAGLL